MQVQESILLHCYPCGYESEFSKESVNTPLNWVHNELGAEFFRDHLNRLICPNCLNYCRRCDEIVNLESPDENFCSECFEYISQEVACEGCGYIEHLDNMHGRPGGRTLCDGCFNREREDERRLIQNYSYKPVPNFHQLAKENTKVFFGVELEVEANSHTPQAGAEIVKQKLGELAYFKQDGSLDHGFEIVTHPMSFAWYKKNLETDFAKELADHGFRSWDTHTCGIHVHVSKSGFSDNAHIWKFCQLILKNKSQWVKIAGRSSTRWATYDPEVNGVADVLKHKKHPERYCAVNLSNRETVEVRIFRGTLNQTRFRSAIEIIAGAFEYTRMMHLKDFARNAIDFANFAKFIELYSDEYPNAFEVIKKKGLI